MLFCVVIIRLYPKYYLLDIPSYNLLVKSGSLLLRITISPLALILVPSIPNVNNPPTAINITIVKKLLGIPSFLVVAIKLHLSFTYYIIFLLHNKIRLKYTNLSLIYMFLYFNCQLKIIAPIKPKLQDGSSETIIPL